MRNFILTIGTLATRLTFNPPTLGRKSPEAEVKGPQTPSKPKAPKQPVPSEMLGPCSKC